MSTPSTLEKEDEPIKQEPEASEALEASPDVEELTRRVWEDHDGPALKLLREQADTDISQEKLAGILKLERRTIMNWESDNWHPRHTWPNNSVLLKALMVVAGATRVMGLIEQESDTSTRMKLLAGATQNLDDYEFDDSFFGLERRQILIDLRLRLNLKGDTRAGIALMARSDAHDQAKRARKTTKFDPSVVPMGLAGQVDLEEYTRKRKAEADNDDDQN